MVSKTVKEKQPRRYDSTRRQAEARLRRMKILSEARDLFIERGYRATTIAMIAERAGVTGETIHAVVGPKAVVLATVVQIASKEGITPLGDYDDLGLIAAKPDARDKLDLCAAMSVVDHQRKEARLLRALRSLVDSDRDAADAWIEIAESASWLARRIANDLVATGQVRPDVSVDEIADVLWAMVGSRFLYEHLVEERGWSEKRFERWLALTLRSQFLVDSDDADEVRHTSLNS